NAGDVSSILLGRPIAFTPSQPSPLEGEGFGLSRRLLLAAPLALAACGSAQPPAPPPPLAPLKSVAPFPVGLSAMTGQFNDPQWVAAVRTHFNQLTPEWEM